MLKELRLHNFKTFLNTKVPFTQRHLIIGRNNSGKSNLCAALNCLRAAGTMDLAVAAQVVPGGPTEIGNRALTTTTVELECVCEVPFGEETLEYTYMLHLCPSAPRPSGPGTPALRVVAERLSARGDHFGEAVLLKNDGRQAELLHEEDYVRSQQTHMVRTLAPPDATMLSKLYELETNRRAVVFRRYLANWAYFALSPEHMRWGWPGRAAGPVGFAARGDNLAAVLFQLKNVDGARYRRVVEHIRRLVEPDLDEINFIPAPDQNVPFVGLHGGQGATWIGLSDGTLRTLALAYIIELAGSRGLPQQEQPPPLVVIEEPENGVFPGLLRELFDLFEEQAPLAQFLFTSHSPYFINLFDGFRESVTLLRRNNERTEVVPVPPARSDPDRELLAEQYSMELLD